MSTDDFSNSSLSFWHGGETPEYKEQSFVCSLGSIYSVSIFLRLQLKITHCMVNFSLYLSHRKISTENVV